VSIEAKLVKMADKIYNLRDLVRCKPIGWTQTRVDDYFVWAKKVTNGLKGVNSNLELILDGIYGSQGL
jgi:guanosine-3',5'-bis(diphosphate) 3'-pyrophosphohydrolase